MSHTLPRNSDQNSSWWTWTLWGGGFFCLYLFVVLLPHLNHKVLLDSVSESRQRLGSQEPDKKS